MNRYLDNIVARTLGSARGVEPRLASVFEPSSTAGAIGGAITDESDPQSLAGVTPAFVYADHGTEDPKPPTGGSASAGITAETASRGTADEKFDRPANHAEGAPHTTENFAGRTLYAGMEQTRRDNDAVRLQLEPHAADSRRMNERSVSQIPDRSRRAGILVSTDTVETHADARHGKLPIGAVPSAAITAGTRLLEAREPAIRISIGRVDVRAIVPAQPESRPPRSERKAFVTLDQYLKRRDGGGR
jgi:hypothetical protein